MRHLKKHRSFLSIYIIVILILLFAAFLIAYYRNGFNVYVTALLAVAILAVIRVFFLAAGFYKELKVMLEAQQKDKDDEITINDIINQKEEQKEEDKNQHDKELDQLIDKLSKESESEKLAQSLLTQLGKEMHIVQGIVYQFKNESEKFEVLSSYAYYGDEPPQSFELGEGLSGQAARDKKSIVLRDLPEGYTKVISGLGEREPKLLLLVPLVHNDKTVALAELAFFEKLDNRKVEKFEGILEKLSKHFA
jgi:putative methionine-R-sulfoxide reductase with GAF domain